jgi:hypothetical protein
MIKEERMWANCIGEEWDKWLIDNPLEVTAVVVFEFIFKFDCRVLARATITMMI